MDYYAEFARLSNELAHAPPDPPKLNPNATEFVPSFDEQPAEEVEEGAGDGFDDMFDFDGFEGWTDEQLSEAPALALV